MYLNAYEEFFINFNERFDFHLSSEALFTGENLGWLPDLVSEQPE